MRYWFVFLTLLNAAAFAEKPLAVIDGPSVGNVGDFVRLSATESVADHVAFSVVPETLPDGRASFMLFDDGRTILIASVPGRYLVILAAATDEGIDVRQHVVTIGNVTPRPEPQPPTPTPTPPEPDPMLQLGEIVRRENGVDNRKQFRHRNQSVRRGRLRRRESIGTRHRGAQSRVSSCWKPCELVRMVFKSGSRTGQPGRCQKAEIPTGLC